MWLVPSTRNSRLRLFRHGWPAAESATSCAHISLPVGSGTTTPRHGKSKRGASKRKQAFLSLPNELTNDEEASAEGELPPTFCTRIRIDKSAVPESNLQPGFRDGRDDCEWLYRPCRPKHGRDLNAWTANVDEYLQTTGAESFERFER